MSKTHNIIPDKHLKFGKFNRYELWRIVVSFGEGACENSKAESNLSRD